MRFYLYLFILLSCFSIKLSAEELESTENQAPVFEPITGDINARLDRIEKTLNNQALLDMLELLESLKIEVSTLRGEIEVQTHTVDQLKQKQRDLYTDIDRRLQRLETNQTTATKAKELQTLSAVESESGNTGEAAEQQTLIVETTSTTQDTQTTEQADEVKKPADPLKAEATYQRAFKLLKETQYDQALKAFKDFLSDYPDSAFSDNAQYWLGETNYVMQQYELAINEYQALLNTYPDSQKVSHALLKIGYSYAELGNASDARKILEEVMDQYPGTTAARLADERLRKISRADESNT